MTCLALRFKKGAASVHRVRRPQASGARDDTYIVNNASDVVTEAGNGRVDPILTSIADDTLRANVEAPYGTVNTGNT